MKIVITPNMISMIKKNLFPIFGHGANCQNIMGAGFASLVKLHFPELYTADKLYGKSHHSRIGSFSKASIENRYLFDTKTITGYNLYTQVFPGPNADHQFIFDSLFASLQDAAPLGDYFAIPHIGAGIGGLGFVDTMETFKEAEDQSGVDCEVVLCLREEDIARNQNNKNLLHIFAQNHKIEILGEDECTNRTFWR